MSRLPFFHRKTDKLSYDFRKLIDTRNLIHYDQAQYHIVCDIDKTYLETKSETALQIIKVALEEAKDKQTVAGASIFLSAARWYNINAPLVEGFLPTSLHFVSASPPQLRATLEQKLLKDQIDWNSDYFKNQAYNIRKGRLSLLRQHIVYKSACILSIVSQAKQGSRFYLIGDNAESDAFIYLSVKLLLEGQIGLDNYHELLVSAGVEKEIATDFVENIKLPENRFVDAILIRQAPGFTLKINDTLAPFILEFHDYFELTLIFAAWNLIDPESLKDLTLKFHNLYNFPEEILIAALEQAKDIFPGLKAWQKSLEAAIAIFGKQTKKGPPANSAALRKMLIEKKLPSSCELTKEFQDWIELLKPHH